MTSMAAIGALKVPVGSAAFSSSSSSLSSTSSNRRMAGRTLSLPASQLHGEKLLSMSFSVRRQISSSGCTRRREGWCRVRLDSTNYVDATDWRGRGGEAMVRILVRKRKLRERGDGSCLPTVILDKAMDGCACSRSRRISLRRRWLLEIRLDPTSSSRSPATTRHSGSSFDFATARQQSCP